MNQRTEQSVNLAGVMTLAAIVGATTALLLAPRKGSETRAKIKQKIEQTRQKSVEITKHKVQDTVDKVKDSAGQASSIAKDAVIEVRSPVEDVAVEVQARQRARRNGTPL